MYYHPHNEITAMNKLNNNKNYASNELESPKRPPIRSAVYVATNNYLILNKKVIYVPRFR